MVLEALAFDMYGTLVNPMRIWTQLEQYMPLEAQRAAEIWRQKQLEYTFRLTANEYFEGFISVDELRVYKPSPKVYQLVADKFARSIQEIRLISSNPFDIIRAQNMGMQVTWLNRSAGLFDTLAPPPKSSVSTLLELAYTI